MRLYRPLEIYAGELSSPSKSRQVAKGTVANDGSSLQLPKIHGACSEAVSKNNRGESMRFRPSNLAMNAFLQYQYVAEQESKEEI